MTSKTKVMIAAAAMTGLVAGAANRALAGSAGKSTEAGIKKMVIGDSKAGVRAMGDDHKGKHDCKGQNECKGQGGCKSGDNGCKGKNSCKGHGGCKSDGHDH